MANETVVTNGDEVANERVRLDATPCADRRATLNLHERADKRPCTDPTSVQVHRPDHAHAFTEIDVDNVSVEESWPDHWARPNRHSLGTNLSLTSHPVSTDS